MEVVCQQIALCIDYTHMATFIHVGMMTCFFMFSIAAYQWLRFVIFGHDFLHNSIHLSSFLRLRAQKPTIHRKWLISARYKARYKVV